MDDEPVSGADFDDVGREDIDSDEIFGEALNVTASISSIDLQARPYTFHLRSRAPSDARTACCRFGTTSASEWK